MGKETKSYLLEEMPKDIYGFILMEQAKLKADCNCVKSIETTIYSMLRKYRALLEKSSTGTPGTK